MLGKDIKRCFLFRTFFIVKNFKKLRFLYSALFLETGNKTSGARGIVLVTSIIILLVLNISTYLGFALWGAFIAEINIIT